MNLRAAILISLGVHVALVCCVELWLAERARWTAEFSVDHGAAVVVMAYSPPVENPFDVPFEQTVVIEEVVEVSLEAPAELEITSKPIPQETPPTDQQAETVKIAPPATTLAASRAEPLKVERKDDITAAPLMRKQALAERKPDAPPTTVTSPPRRKQSLPPPVRSQPIAVVTRTPSPFRSTAPPGASVDQLPRQYLNNPAPFYPRDALAAGVEGRVMLRITIESTGTVGAVQVSTSSGWESLDGAALAAVRAWRFEPARRSGEAVAYEVIVPVRFAIRRS